MQMKLDATSLGELFEAEGPRLLAFATRRTFDAEQALDVVGECFAVAFERRAKFRGATREEAVGWLYAICRTVLHHHFRRQGAESIYHFGFHGLQFFFVLAVVKTGIERKTFCNAFHIIIRDQNFQVGIDGTVLYEIILL